MRILHVVATYWPAVRYGGTIASVRGLCRALAANGHDVHVYTTSVDGPGDLPVAHGVPVDVDGVKVWYFRSRLLRRIYRSPALGNALVQHVREFDVVHTHAVFLWPLWAAARAASGAGVPYVMSPRGMLERQLIVRRSRLLKTAWIALIEKRSLKEAAAIHVTSAREAAELVALGFDLPRLVELPNGVDLESDGGDAGTVSPAIRRIASGPPYVLFLGRISWKKGLERLLRAMPFMPADLHVVVAGNDEEGLRPALQEQAQQLSVGGRLQFTGAVGAADRDALLSAARLLVLPSYSENFGNVVVEAMAAGCPVIVSPEVGVAPMVERTAVGWVVDADDAATLGASISELSANPALRQDMAARGRLVARQEFSWRAVATGMESAYRAVRSGSATTPITSAPMPLI